MRHIGLVITLVVISILLVVSLLEARNSAVAAEFKRVTGYPNGRVGWIVDHKIPICAGGPDTIDNLQWQIKALSYRKDAFERALCSAMRVQGLTMVKQ